MGAEASSCHKSPAPMQMQPSDLPQKRVVKGELKREKLLCEDVKKIHDVYRFEAELGRGAYGSVTKVVQKDSGKFRACKSIVKRKVSDVELVKNEIRAMQSLNHPNVVKLFASFEDKHSVYLVMELCSGGELFDIVGTVHELHETKIATLMLQVIRAIHHMHRHQIMHRDVKAEHFMFSSMDSSQLKLIDFGWACKVKDGEFRTTRVGTPYYIAPEVVVGKYSKSADVWSCGVIMFMLIAGYAPFDGASPKEMLKSVTHGHVEFDPEYWSNISSDATNLIGKMLQKDPIARITAKDALNDQWFEDNVCVGAQSLTAVKMEMPKRRFASASWPDVFASPCTSNKRFKSISF